MIIKKSERMKQTNPEIMIDHKNYLLGERRNGPKVENDGTMKTTCLSKTFE